MISIIAARQISIQPAVPANLLQAEYPTYKMYWALVTVSRLPCDAELELSLSTSSLPLALQALRAQSAAKHTVSFLFTMSHSNKHCALSCLPGAVWNKDQDASLQTHPQAAH